MDDQPDDSFEPVNEPLAAPVITASEKTAEPELSPSGITSMEKAVPQQHSWFYRFFHFLLGADTAVGRVLRPVLRWTAAVVGLFALGLLVGYLLLYQPAQQALLAGQQDNGALHSQISSLQDQVKILQSQVSNANLSVGTAQDALAKARARNNLLVVIYDIANARAFLAQKDGASLIKTLDKTRTDLDTLQPYLLSVKKDLADELNARLETVRSVVVRDAALAQSDLDNLFTALVSANTLIFGVNP